MDKKDYYKALEELNAQLLSHYNGRIPVNNNSKDKKGRKKADIFRRVYTKLLSKRPSDVNLPTLNLKKVSEYDTHDKRIAVYTCIVGNYDFPIEPIFQSTNIDYFIFSDNKVESTIWKRKEIPENLINMDNTLLNRYIKMHPFEFFSDYDFAVYVDGNVKIVGDVSEMINLLNPQIGLGLHKHARRDSIYNEAKVLNIYKKGNKNQINEQVSFYRKNKFPHKYGMLEATIIISEISNETAKQIMLEWWEEFFSRKSYRDQLSLPYILWKKNITIDDVGVLGNNLYKNPKFQIIEHV